MAAERSDIVAFGLAALACSNKARLGMLGLCDRLGLARAALDLAAVGADVVAATREFLDAANADSTAAGDALSLFLDRWMDRRVPKPAPGPGDWRTRKDCGL